MNGNIYFKNLDSIRFIAALMVYLQHGVSQSYQFLNIKGTVFERILNVISSGGTGVSIFFVLSGFLITYLLISEHESNGGISIKNFYVRRVLRIWPLFFLVVFFSFFLYPQSKSLFNLDSPTGANIWYHVTFLSNFDVINIENNCRGNDVMSQNITWSVSIEEQFYLFWPLIFAFTPKRLWGWAIGSVILFSLGFRFFHNDDSVTLYFHTFSVLMDLGIGGLYAYAIKKSTLVKDFFKNAGFKIHLFSFMITGALLFLPTDYLQWQYSESMMRLFLVLSFGFVIASQAMTTVNSGLNLSNLVFFNKWGKYTYGIYLIHPIALTLLGTSYKILNIDKESFVKSMLFACIAFILTLVLSKLSYEYFEARFLRLKEKFQKGYIKGV
jgi:peptidoglycan/LPS O-acetylase OafA/YrhL